MTVPQDTVLCAGLGLLPALLAPRATGRRGAWAALVVGWVPVSAVFLVLWPAWSWWYPPGRLGEVLSRPEVSLGLGLAVEVLAFAAALHWSAGRSGPMIRKAMSLLLFLYVALLIFPAPRWLAVGTAEDWTAGTTRPLWGDPGLLAALAGGGLWLLVVQAVALRRARAVSLVALLLLAGCGGGEPAPVAPPPPPPARIAVAPDAHAVVDALIRGAFGAAEDGVRGLPSLQIDPGGAAYAALMRGDADGAVVLRAPSAAERKTAAGDALLARDPLLQRTLAHDAVVLAVPAASGVTTLDFDAAVAVLSGDRAQWSGLGDAGPILVLGPPRGDSARALVEADLLGGRSMGGGLVEMTSSRAVVERLRATPGAVGLTSLSALRGARAISLRTPDGLILEPRAASQTGEWPLVRPVLLVTQGPPHPQLDALVAFAGSEAGRAVVRKQGMNPAKSRR